MKTKRRKKYNKKSLRKKSYNKKTLRKKSYRKTFNKKKFRNLKGRGWQQVSIDHMDIPINHSTTYMSRTRPMSRPLPMARPLPMGTLFPGHENRDFLEKLREIEVLYRQRGRTAVDREMVEARKAEIKKLQDDAARGRVWLEMAEREEYKKREKDRHEYLNQRAQQLREEERERQERERQERERHEYLNRRAQQLRAEERERQEREAETRRAPHERLRNTQIQQSRRKTVTTRDARRGNRKTKIT